MASQRRPQSSRNEEGVILALGALKNNAFLTLRRASSIFEVPRSNLSDRVRREESGRISAIRTMKITSTEALAIVQHVLDLDMRGVSPTKAILRDMTNKGLAERGGARRRTHWSPLAR